MEGDFEQKSDSGKKIPAGLILALILLAGFAVYFNSLKGEFLWDDIHFIKNNTYLRSWSHLPEIFTSDVAAGSGMRYDYYRPLATFTYLIDYSFFRLESRGYHLFSIIYHLLVGLSIYFLVGLLFRDRLLAGLTAIFWLIHPLQTETVAYISGRPDSLVALFVLLTIILYLRQMRSSGLYFLMCLSGLAAVLSRENCVVLPALILLYHFIFRRRVRLSLFAPILLLILAYVTGRLFFLNSPHLAPPLGERITGSLAALVSYLRLLLFPIHLHQEYGWHFSPLFSPGVLLGAGGLATLFLLWLRGPSFREASRESVLLFRFGVGWFFVALLPMSGIYPIKANLAEHWLYLPSIGFFLVLSRGVLFLSRKAAPRPVIAALGALALCWGALTVHQNGYFRDPFTFYRRSARYSPFSARLRNNLGIQYYLRGREEEGIECFKKALELDPEYPEACNNLGQIYMNRGREREAEALLVKAISINPGYADGYNNLGILFSRRGEPEKSLRFLEKAARLNPLDPGILFNLGIVLEKAGKDEEAIRALKRSLLLYPDRAPAYSHLARLYYRKGELKLARKYYRESLRRGGTPDKDFAHRLGKLRE